MVPLVADFLRKKKFEVVAETGDRLEKRALALIFENGFEKHERFSVLDAAWPSVAPALPRFFAGPNEQLQSVCAALQTFLNITGRWDEWLALSLQAEAKAVAVGDHPKAGWQAYLAGSVYNRRRQADAVLDCAARAAAHWDMAFPKGTGAPAGVRERAAAIQLRGHGHSLKKNYIAAIADFRDVVELDRSLSQESADVVIDLNVLANAESDSGDFAAAEGNYREALRVARLTDYTEGIATYTGNLAALALVREAWPQAEALVREALSLAEKVGRQDLIASDCRRLAMALVRQGKGKEGRTYAMRAVGIFTRLGSPNVASAQRTLRECEDAAGDEAGA